MVYVATPSTVRAFDSSTGSILDDWNATIDANVLSGPVLTDSTGYLPAGSYGDGVEQLYSFDVQSGTTNWAVSVPGSSLGGIAILEDVLVFGTENGVVAMA